MTYKNIIDKHHHKLQNITNISRKEVEILISYILQKDITYIHKNYDKFCICQEKIIELIHKRATAYPIEYITNIASFYSEQFFVQEGVLIPRPETELLIDEAITTLQNISNPKVLEIGCGSGVVSIVLAKKVKNISITATDISDIAIKTTKINITKHKQTKNIKVLKSNLFENVPQQKFDMVISNPPYIKNDIKLHKSLSFEPNIALYGGKKGDELLKKIIKEFFLLDVRYLVCEIGHDQKDELRRYFKNFSIKYLKFYKDYAHFDRGFVLERL